MNKETKRCPYCGELILATAVKCRYCRAWIVPQESVKPVEPETDKSLDAQPAAVAKVEIQPQKEEAVEQEVKAAKQEIEPAKQEAGSTNKKVEWKTPNLKFKVSVPFGDGTIKLLFWMVVIGVACTVFHDYFTGEEYFGSGSAGIVADILDWIPSWAGSLMSAIGSVLLLYALREGLKAITSTVDVWLLCCIALEIVANLYDLVFDSSEELGTFFVIVGVCGMVAYVIAGVKMLKIDDFMLVGWSFIAFPAVLFAEIIIIGIIGTDSEFGFVLKIMFEIIVPCIPFFAIKEKCVGDN